MFVTYLKIAIRTFRKHKAHALINLSGLSIGIACCILISLYIQDELSFDLFHKNSDRIFRVLETQHTPEQGERQFASTMAPVGPSLVSDFPEVVESVRLIQLGRLTIQSAESRFYEAFLVAEPGLFSIFDFQFLQGEPAGALREPNSVVLTDETAHKYFGDQNPVGRVLTSDRGIDFTVTGVIKSIPHNSHLQFNMVFSLSTFHANENWQEYLVSWEADGIITYVLLDKASTAQELQGKLPAFLDKYVGVESGKHRLISLQPLADIHFHSSDIESDWNAYKSDIAYTIAFGAISLFILLIACVNYMNLATARSMSRANEVGLRKVVGAYRFQLVYQFLCESIALSFAALLLAIAVVQHALPYFNSLTGKTLDLDFLSNGPTLLGLAALACLVGVISGSYPALYLSRMQIVSILKGRFRAGVSQARLRRGLVVAQFSLSIIMIIATLVVFSQMDFIKSKRLGFNQEHLVVVDINSSTARKSFRAMVDEFSRNPEVRSVSVTSRVPGEWKNIRELEVVGEGAQQAYTVNFFGVDENFLETFEVELFEGRNFRAEMATDTTSVLINETAARQFGWDSPLGKTIQIPAQKLGLNIIGVVKDFHFRSLHETIGPLVLGHSHNPIQSIDYFTARISENEIGATLDHLRRVHVKFDEVTPFEYHFLDQQLENFYKADKLASRMFAVAASLAVLIACLGLFGLAAFSAEQRTKEIGIRKVFGASTAGVVALLSHEFIKLVFLANLIAWPLAWLAMNRWLQDFAYRVEMSGWIFLLAGSLALLIALLTVSYQAIRAALANPVDALKYE